MVYGPKGIKIDKTFYRLFMIILYHSHPIPNYSREDLDDEYANYTFNVWDDFSNTNYPEYDMV
tara:strand:+ start:812 stop:1000 length:189 start_codon:yes stop_codon:yes gene_type:complete